MKKQPTSLQAAITAATGTAKKPTYVYTEEDLGEGILDVGVSC